MMSASLLSRCGRFARDFARFCGAQGGVVLSLVLLGSLLESVGLVFLIPIMGVVLGAQPQQGMQGHFVAALLILLGPGSRLRHLGLLLALFVLLMIVRALVIGGRDLLLARLQARFIEQLRLDVVTRLAASRWAAAVRLRHGRVLHLMGGDVLRVASALRVLLQSSAAIVMLLGQILVALLLSPLFAGLAMIFLLAGAMALGPSLRRSSALGENFTTTNLLLMDRFVQFMGGLKFAKSQGLEEIFVGEFRHNLQSQTERQIDFQLQQTVSRLVVNTLVAFAAAGMIFMGFGYLDLSAAVLVTLLLLLARMTAPALMVYQGVQQFVQVIPAYDEIRALEQELAEAVETPSRDATLPVPQGPIIFRDVSLSYADETGNQTSGGLRPFNLTIMPGEIVGVAGPSGAGKTSFADLLVGLMPPQTGSITVGGMPLDSALLKSWRHGIAYLAQDAFVMNDTVRRNLLWADPHADEAVLQAVLAAAGADTLVARMEKGLDTMLGERGARISGGERQRLALARALLRRPSLLVLDEATNAIDSESEQAILARLAGLTPRPTIVIVAHRPGSFAFCERVISIENGVIAS